MPKISVIIPIYNVEEYLAKCLNSVVNQTFKDIEILCVNDCSPDNCLQILEDYAQKDNRIKIINREKNGGLSAARNSGLDVAKGDYIYFIDSDDWIELDYLEKMYNIIVEKQVSILLNTNMIEITRNSTKSLFWKTYEMNLEAGEYIDTKFSIENTPCMTPLHMYKKSFIDEYNLRFPVGYIHEDNYFKAISEIYLDRIYAFSGPAYFYTMSRKSSITKSDENILINHIKIWKLIFNYYKENNLLSKIDLNIIDFDYFAKVNNEEAYKLAKDFISFLEQEYNVKTGIKNECTFFVLDILLNSKNFTEYNQKIPVNKDARLAFIRYKKEIENDKNICNNSSL